MRSEHEEAIVATREIPIEEWTEFLNDFTRRHDAWITSVELIDDPDLGTQMQFDQLAFIGASPDPKEGRCGAIEIIAASDLMDHVTHVVENPVAVRVREGEGGVDALEIEAGNGSKTLVLLSREAIRLSPMPEDAQQSPLTPT